MGIEAELYIGDNYFRREYFAADSYQSFIKLHPTHPKTDYAYYAMAFLPQVKQRRWTAKGISWSGDSHL